MARAASTLQKWFRSHRYNPRHCAIDLSVVKYHVQYCERFIFWYYQEPPIFRASLYGMNPSHLVHLKELQSKLSIRQLELEILQGYDREQLLTNKFGPTASTMLSILLGSILWNIEFTNMWEGISVLLPSFGLTLWEGIYYLLRGYTFY